MRSCLGPARLCFLVVACVALVPAAKAQKVPFYDPREPQQMMDEYRRVDQYLSKLKLTDQRLILIERYLLRPVPPKQREKLLATASRLYATQLMTYADDPARSKHYREQVEAFLAANPQADTPELQVMLLQADYNRGESAASRWLNDPTDVESKKTAREVFARIAPKLVEFHRLLEKRVEAEYDQIDRLMPGPRREEREQENEQLEGVVGRAAFFGAWSNYYLVLVDDLPATARETKIAIDLFRQLLDLVDDPQATTAWHERADANRMGLQQEWRARALIGLAMAEILDDDLPDARRCFTLLQSGPTSPDIIDQADYWYVRGLLNADKQEEAVGIAKTIVLGYQGASSPGKTSLCVLLADTGLRAQETDPKLYEMGVLGLVGLAKLGHHSAAIQLMEKYEIELEETPSFYMLWLIGQQKFAEAEKSMSDAEYRLAQTELTKALAAPEAKDDLASSSECRYTLGWCCYRLEEYVEAGQYFQDAVVGLRGVNSTKAAEAAWMSFVSYQTLAKDQPQFGLRAIDVLEDLKRDFPEHPYAQKADYFIAKLQQSRGSMTSSIRQLQGIDSSDANFWSAKFDLCNLLRQKIDQAASEDEQKELARQLQDVVNDLQSRLKPDSAPPDQISGVVRCVLNVADLARKNLLDAGEFSASVAEAKALVERLPKDDRAWIDYHYQALLLARQQKQQTDVSQHAKWLLDNAQGTPYEQSALIIRALEIDRLVAATNSPGEDLLNEGLSVYTRLLKHLGSTAGAIKQSKNAKVACSKAADFAEKLAKWHQAATHLRVLVEAYPTEQEYLQRLGRVEFNLGNYSAAVGYWRTLLVGLDKGSEGWFEAKYYQLACLKEVDPAQAKTVAEQFQLLHPDWGLPPWRDKIKGLAEQISSLSGS
ncbi:hypothetical protein DTL21_19690 [Bremerella cremea]|uniref:Outer membrane lipoprotein BamD-like domain-containing protein n=2 Tax=Pirellulales TaxID=2691354 RepID=A0A2S8FK83_9BACT|nr:hypothetical protein C5Y83_19670 [Blastopirellula marina]RCS45507.1 hypothetical protein DTL21_19690 [Bremerella cremea]